MIKKLLCKTLGHTTRIEDQGHAKIRTLIFHENYKLNCSRCGKTLTKKT